MVAITPRCINRAIVELVGQLLDRDPFRELDPRPSTGVARRDQGAFAGRGHLLGLLGPLDRLAARLFLFLAQLLGLLVDLGFGRWRRRRLGFGHRLAPLDRLGGLLGRPLGHRRTLGGRLLGGFLPAADAERLGDLGRGRDVDRVHVGQSDLAERAQHVDDLLAGLADLLGEGVDPN
jgi:hypothetical protein